MRLHIGIDDTDSKNEMCTTYLAATLKEKLEFFSTVIEMRLVRLNPNIPWKTRGNGAVALIIDTDNYKRARNVTKDLVKEMSCLDEDGTNPGMVFYSGEVDEDFTSFYFKALRSIVTINDAVNLAEDKGCEYYTFNSGRGLIGALAAVGADLSTSTYEYIAYRRPENWGTRRQIDKTSVFEMDRATLSCTFNNVDSETSQILIAPHSKCPVLFGVRAVEKGVLDEVKIRVKVGEPIEREAFFKTNQGTDAHLMEKKISEVKPYDSAILEGCVTEPPRTLKGGHVIFSIEDGEHSIDCAAYEPTGNFRGIVKQLQCGDSVRVYGGVKNTKKLTVNLEKIEVKNLAEAFDFRNPRCPACNGGMESSGKGQGYRCRKCRTTSKDKEVVKLKRHIKKGLYCVPPRAMRHLSKPINLS